MSKTVLIPTQLVKANPHQPRTYFNSDQISELALSIQENGLIQPIVVRAKDDHYEIIAGERRFRACNQLEMHNVPCIIMNKDDLESSQIALVENIQRQDLSAIEEAKAYVKIIEETGISQSDLAKKMGKSQSAIANKIRLLALPANIQQKVNDKTITERHARALLKVKEASVDDVLDVIIKKGLNVAQSEEYINKLHEKPKKKNITKGYSKNIKIGINTIQQAVNMCKQANIDTDVIIDENDSEVRMIIVFNREGE